ncbi:A/G-specific adenine glycosylase [Rubellimicrobium mesophilum DSM 19309]|uniref:Adenine DNA glycosylase n=1 Tax=Rubellimicrobium mesophilum DSM 19309 TaxID=442562 RepID=A0A017HLM4_9RHOB|nr:A/G-specific adenine glycosylase [Rubellimicrobium mesophilum]EYD74674.1 A/G-specific adenine glycosylase [Rubellimicrobium mesophilum DSM 19309]
MTDLARDLLDWYDRHARVLPWRVPPGSGEVPEPYRVWLSEVMLQQTTVAAVKGYYERFTARWPTVEALAAVEDAEVMAEWAGLGYYARARNLLACARAVAERGGFPRTEAGLRELPGIGPYTAAAIATIAFGERAVVVDGNVERVMARVFDVTTPLPAARPEIYSHADSLTPADRPGDFAQAVMDLGATICTPRNPACAICPWREPCLARQRSVQAERPVKLPKRAVPQRRGLAYVGRREDGAWLLETRGADRMLGGMLGWPGSAWDRGEEEAEPPAPGDWVALNAEARHGFSHFGLTLRVLVARLPMGTEPSRGAFMAASEFRPGMLPTAMRRVLEVAETSPLIRDPEGIVRA